MLRLLVIVDLFFQSNFARTQLMSFLIQDMEMGAEQAWQIYHRCVRWWSVFSPLSYLMLGGVFRYALNLLEPQSLGSLTVGALFIASMVMSITAAIRLVPLRRQLDAPSAWVDFELSLIVESDRDPQQPA